MEYNVLFLKPYAALILSYYNNQNPVLREKLERRLNENLHHFRLDEKTKRVSFEETKKTVVVSSYDVSIKGNQIEILSQQEPRLRTELVHTILECVSNSSLEQPLLNGIGQMITEQILPTTCTKQWPLETLIAVYLKHIMSEEVIENAYFYQDHTLETYVNRYADSSNFFLLFQKKLQWYQSFERQLQKSDSKLDTQRTVRKTKNTLETMIFCDIFYHLLVPKLNELHYKDRRIFVKELLDDIKDEEEKERINVKLKLVETLTEEELIEQEQNDLFGIPLLGSDESQQKPKAYYYVKESGEVYEVNNKETTQIEDQETIDKIFTSLFLTQQGSVEVLRKKVVDCCKRGYFDIQFDSVMTNEKRKELSALRFIAKEEGYELGKFTFDKYNNNRLVAKVRRIAV